MPPIANAQLVRSKLTPGRIPVMRRRLRYLVTVLALLLGIPTLVIAEEEYATARQGVFQNILIESGEIAAVDQVSISAPRNWHTKLQVTDLVPEGAQVQAGDFLVQFDDRDSRAALDQAVDALLSLEADLAALQAQQSLQMAELESSYQMSLHSKGLSELRVQASRFESETKQSMVRLQFKQAEIRLSRLETEIESQKTIHHSQLIRKQMELSQAQGRVDEAQAQIDGLRVVAPIDGLVVYREVGGWSSRERLREGYTAWPSEGLMSIPDLSRMEARLYVSEVDWPLIRVGQIARVSLDAYPDIMFPGCVADVAKLASESPSAHGPPGFLVVITIDGTSADLRPGMTARVVIVLEELGEVVMVPVGTVFELSGRPVVFRRASDCATAVELGPRNDREIVITQGLPAGADVLFRPPLDEAEPLGAALEWHRISKAERLIAHDLEVLAERGLLFEYGPDSLSTQGD